MSGTRNARGVRLVAAIVASLLGMSVAVVPVRATAAGKPTPPAAQPVKSVPVRAVSPATPDAGAAMPDATKKAAPIWPAAGSAQADVLATSAKVGTMPVSVSRPTGAATAATTGVAPSRVLVQVLDRATTDRSGVRGVLVRVGRADGVALAAAVDLTVDYRGFATAYGADWASRLRLVSLPECALTTPESPACAGTPLVSRNDTVAGTVTARVPAAAAAGERVPGHGAAEPPQTAAPVGALLAIAAASSGAAGDYKATSLAPSATWSAGSSSGDFTWSYPMRTPPGLEGPTPDMQLSYSAQSVDGRMVASNNQPSWAGEGFEFMPGDYIERRYRACGSDMDGTGHNNTTKTGDLCWETDNATMSLSGHGGELLYNATEDRWHLRKDDGTRIEKVVGGSSWGNGDNNGEYWKVTTTEGTQYYFGRHKLDGWTSGKPTTNSTWTVPVFGNDPGEPCHATTFAGSDCAQAWRWNLDYVVDPHGNTMSLWYATETNKYARNLTASDLASYVRGGYVTRVDYGTDNRTLVGGVRTDSQYAGVDAPMRAVFSPADRCLAGCATHDAAHWPDTPWDQVCTDAPCLIGSPTFWLTKRLSTVTTQVRHGTAYDDVERWTLTHTFPDPGDGTRAGLWLSRISHHGLVGTDVSMPDVEFTGVQLSNRVDTIDHSPAMNWWRIAMIRNEAGGTVNVTYSSPDCVVGSRMPSAPHTNTLRCYPVVWTPEGFVDPITDYFQKYVVTIIYETDQTGGVPPNGSPRIVHTYSYLDDPAWHYADDDGLIGKKEKTWSAWRGYARVGVTTGDVGEQTYTETRFLRGMNGDKLPSGTRSVTVPGTGVSDVADEDAYAGMAREAITFNGPGGAVVSRNVFEPWQSAATATRTINGSTVYARFTNTATTYQRVALDGGRADRVSRSSTTFDAYGFAVQVDDSGDTSVTGDEQCAQTTYEPRNTSAWLMASPHLVRTYAVSCAAAANPATLGDAAVVASVRSSYDGAAAGTAPVRGDVTQVDEMSAWNAGAPSYVTTSKASYDVHGRVVEARDPMDRATTVAFTPATGGPVTKMVVTNPLDHVVSTELAPQWGQSVATIDANDKRTDLSYDGLGRLTKVWKPGRDRGLTANISYTYAINQNAPSVVTTSTLNAAGDYVTGYQLYDGLLRSRQSQTPSPSGGRLLTDTFYDTAGRTVKQYGAYYNSTAPGGTLVVATERSDVPNQTRTVYDGAGRTLAEVFQPYDVERWRTTTYYAGDRVDVTPPAGATATSTVSDAHGRKVELRQFRAATPSGPYDVTGYQYNAKGQLTRITEPSGIHWDYQYDLRGRQVQVADPDKGTATMEYDNAGRLTSTTDARGSTLLYTYDALGRKTAMFSDVLSVNARARWFYDTVAKGQLAQSVRYDGTNAYVTKVLGYTDDYQPTGSSIIIPDAETGLGGTYTYAATYNVDGSVATSSLPATADLPAETLSNHFDETLGLANRLTTIYGTDQFSYVADTDYNALGQVDQYELYTGLYSETGSRVFESFTRELETGRLTGLRTDRELISPFTVADVHYSYDNAGNVTSASDVAAPGGADNQCFRYDYLRRLSEAWTPSSGDCAATPTGPGLGGPAKYWQSWTFDTRGNRATQVDHATTTGDRTTSYQYPASTTVRPHALASRSTQDSAGTTTASYTYDLAGNTATRPTGSAATQTLTWDVEGHLATSSDSTAGSGVTSYLYDADGNRLIQRDPTGKTLNLPGQEVRWTASSGAKACTRYYTFNGQTIASRTVTKLSWLSSDQQGTAQVAIDSVTQQATIRRQAPYGATRGPTSAWPNPRGFVGGVNDATGLTHLGAREYDPVIGRFISVDPVFQDDDPQQMDGYSYARKSPVTSSDPDGQDSQDQYIYVGTRKWSETRNGYKYYFVVDSFLRCRYSNGWWCQGGRYNSAGWVNMQAFYQGVAGLWVTVFRIWQITRVRLNFIGPVAGPRSLVPRAVPTAPACPRAPEPQATITASDGPSCHIWDLKCLANDPGTWWKSNKDLVTGTAAVGGAVLCIVATAGVCGVASAVGLGISMGARAIDFVNDKHYKSASGWGQLGLGWGIDIAAYYIPGVRSFRTTRSGGTFFNGAGKKVNLSWSQEFGTMDNLNQPAIAGGVGRGAAQLGWLGASLPNAAAPWQFGQPLTDPFQW